MEILMLLVLIAVVIYLAIGIFHAVLARSFSHKIMRAIDSEFKVDFWADARAFTLVSLFWICPDVVLRLLTKHNREAIEELHKDLMESLKNHPEDTE